VLSYYDFWCVIESKIADNCRHDRTDGEAVRGHTHVIDSEVQINGRACMANFF